METPEDFVFSVDKPCFILVPSYFLISSSFSSFFSSSFSSSTFVFFTVFSALFCTYFTTAPFLTVSLLCVQAKKSEKLTRKQVASISLTYKPEGAPEKGAKGKKSASRPSSGAVTQAKPDIGKLLVTCPATPGVQWVFYLQGQP
jgi:hypothetical protein